jgi:alcohol dehydrogenase
MRAVQVSRPGGPLEIVEREIPEPGPGFVRIKVQACGVCHSDTPDQGRLVPGIQYPRVPGHEVIGVIDAVGANVPRWKAGQRVGVGWNGGFCGYCDNCRRGDFFACQTSTDITGVSRDGGYAEYMLAAHQRAGIGARRSFAVDAAPLMCAGVTTFNCLRNSGARPRRSGRRVGIGGLGHLAVQFAAKMGCKTVAIARGKTKSRWPANSARTITSIIKRKIPRPNLQKLGGAKVILATVTSADAMKAVLGGLGVRGTLMVIGAVPSLEVNTLQMLFFDQSVRGWYSGTSIDSQDTLNFSVLSGVRSMNEVFPLDRAAEAYDHMMSGKARFRVVLNWLSWVRSAPGGTPAILISCAASSSLSRWSSSPCACPSSTRPCRATTSFISPRPPTRKSSRCIPSTPPMSSWAATSICAANPIRRSTPGSSRC